MSFTFDLEPEFLALYERCRDETMTSLERMYALYSATRYVIANDIAGDFVECGVWRGGSVMLIALTLQQLGVRDRTLWLYDTFHGMTAPSDDDVQTMSGRSASEILCDSEKSGPFWGIATRDVVERNLASIGYPLVRFVEGDVLTTIPAHAPSQIALLRLDTDWYSSTLHELTHLHPRITRDGVLIVDDYGYWSGARKATDEWFASIGEQPLLHRIDYTGRMTLKR